MNLIILHLKHKSGTGLVYVIGPDWLKTIKGSIDRCLYAASVEAQQTGFQKEFKHHFDR